MSILLIGLNYFDLSQAQIAKTGRITLSDDSLQWEMTSQTLESFDKPMFKLNFQRKVINIQ